MAATLKPDLEAITVVELGKSILKKRELNISKCSASLQILLYYSHYKYYFNINLCNYCVLSSYVAASHCF